MLTHGSNEFWQLSESLPDFATYTLTVSARAHAEFAEKTNPDNRMTIERAMRIARCVPMALRSSPAWQFTIFRDSACKPRTVGPRQGDDAIEPCPGCSTPPC